MCMCRLVIDTEVFFFFFFQAEDGIRDVAVTGVQTCALPIFRGFLWWAGWRPGTSGSGAPTSFLTSRSTIRAPSPWPSAGRTRSGRSCRRRSEEHTSELQSRLHLVCRLLLEKKKKYNLRVSVS